jgi:hypothetical protein
MAHSILLHNHDSVLGLALQVRCFPETVRVALGTLQQMLSAGTVQEDQVRSLLQGSEDRTGGGTFDVLQMLPQLGRQLSTELDAFDASKNSLVDALAVLRKQVLPQAEASAQLLWQHWHQPARQAVARLELAQAAATRCCAYLRCAQLGAQGGPAAGEGLGSKRCSGCRTAWYCGAACQRADWRAGHKELCKALAAAQAQQQKD